MSLTTNQIDELRAYAKDRKGELAKLINDAADTIEMLSAKVRKPPIEPEPKWIPCSETPDTDRNVFIARGEQSNMTACIGHYDHDYKQWYEDRNWFAKFLYDELYWCEIPPLPEPYRGEGD